MDIDKHSSLATVVNLSGRSHAEIQRLLGISCSTWRRWGREGFPEGALFALRVLCGWMPWHGWSVDRSGLLRNDTGTIYITASDIELWQWMLMQAPSGRAVMWQAYQAEKVTCNSVVVPK